MMLRPVTGSTSYTVLYSHGSRSMECTSCPEGQSSCTALGIVTPHVNLAFQASLSISSAEGSLVCLCSYRALPAQLLLCVTGGGGPR